MAKSNAESARALSKTDGTLRKDQTKLSGEDLPRKTLQEALTVVDAIHKNYPGSASWEEIAEVLKVSPTNANNKYSTWAATAYGLLTKSEDNQYEVAEVGRKIIAPEYKGEDIEGKVKAILTPRILSRVFTDYNGKQLPEAQHFPNVLENRYKVPRDRLAEAIRLIQDNGVFAGILQPLPDGGWAVRVDSPTLASSGGAPSTPEANSATTQQSQITDSEGINYTYDWSKTCFLITPIGDDGSEQRKHADMILKHVVEPTAKEHGLEVVRADKIARSGLITQQIFDQLVRAKLCVADLSFNNANVFYELGVRHTCKLPTVQLIRKGDKIPFDVSQGRTIVIDTTDIYSIVDRLHSAQRELSQHVRHFLASNSTEPGEDNPVHLYLPKLRVTLS